MVGTVLENGSVVIAARLPRDEEYVVLAFRANHPVDKYVTWKMDELGQCWSGNYFSDLRQALDDYESRWA